MTKYLKLIILLLLLLSTAPAMAELPDHPLIAQAQSEAARRVNYAEANDAIVELTADGKIFYVLWLPEGATPEDPPPMIVTIHGHGSWAFDEFYLWHKAAKARGYGILAIQWWLGKGDSMRDYLIPQEIYRAIDQVLNREHVKPGTVLFHGFSRGSANSYAVAALDNTRGGNYFALIVANAGKPGIDYPPNREIEQGLYGREPLRGTHWVTFAGGQDIHPERDGIAGMREAAEWIRRYGGTVDIMIEDKNAGHGGFHQDPVNMNAALDIFEERLKEAPHVHSKGI
ncbi:MAG: hypothetical protein WCT15_06445 [Candidatus Omnitrophota bacterium]